ncbi:hypothetical protein ACP70R_037911 [Stipagrostis hirtigluma subsp. patula]
MGSFRPPQPFPLFPTVSSAVPPAPQRGSSPAESILLPRHFREAIPQGMSHRFSSR